MRRFLALLTIVFLALAGCGSSGSDPEAADTATQADEQTTSENGQDGEATADGDATITIQDFAYGEPLTVAPGATIKVVNLDSARHDVDALDGAFQTELIGQNEELTFTAPTDPGEYEFTCSLHPEMRGTLIVAAES